MKAKKFKPAHMIVEVNDRGQTEYKLRTRNGNYRLVTRAEVEALLRAKMQEARAAAAD